MRFCREGVLAVCFEDPLYGVACGSSAPHSLSLSLFESITVELDPFFFCRYLLVDIFYTVSSTLPVRRSNYTVFFDTALKLNLLWLHSQSHDVSFLLWRVP